MRTLLLPLAIAACYVSAACTKSPSEPPQIGSPASSATLPASSVKPSQAAASDSIVIQTGSPDQAVKSWWRYIDLVLAEAADACKKNQADPSPNHLKYLSRVSDGEVLAARTPQQSDCSPEVFAREIDEVKSESETRAIVFVTVRNATPVPIGAEPDELDKKWRTSGFKFKYLVEKVGGEWKIAQAYRYNESNKYLKKELWEKLYVPSDKPRVPAYVHHQ